MSGDSVQIGKQLADLLLERFRAYGLVQSGELLLRHADALRLIQECASMGVVILGFDLYWDSDGAEINWADFRITSADLSSLSGRPNAVAFSTQAAMELIGEGLPDGADWVSFVLA